MDLSIVIVSWNTHDLLRDCLLSVPEACGSLTCEIFVVDNASADSTAEMVARDFPHVRLIESGGNLGFARANNLALPHTSGRAVLLLNPDTVCPPASLARLFRFAMGKEQVGAAAPRLVDGDGRPVISGGWFPRASHHWLGFLDPRRMWLRGPLADRITFIPGRDEPSRPVEYVTGACFLIPRPALETVGPLDDRFFMYFEETDWCLRAREAGLEIWYCAETEVLHLEGRAAEQAGSFSLLQFQKSYRLFVAKHHGPRAVWWFRLAQWAEYGGKSLWRRMRGDKDLAAAYAARAKLQLTKEISVEPPA
ncbi:MAG: glycosyltransferase family 2 protein [bacterium]|nr:glycosyltransferase family 2 protein [bacterium]